MDFQTQRTKAMNAIEEYAYGNDRFKLTEINVDASTGTRLNAAKELASKGIIEREKEGGHYWISKLNISNGKQPDLSPKWQEGPFKILHCFADHGVESEALSAYGEVYRVGLNPKDTNRSYPIKADANQLPFEKNTFDVGFFHPECARFSRVTNISGNQQDHPNQIPIARDVGERYCDEYVIENVPRAIREGEMEKPKGGSLFKLSGFQFGLPIRYQRAFETSFECNRRPIQQPLNQEISPYFSADRSTEYWRSLKGYSGPYTKAAIARNCIPSPYVHWIMREFLRNKGVVDSQPARSTHDDPKPK